MYIKAFDQNLTCRGFQFEVGKTYEIEGDLKMCEHGFHYCHNLNDTIVFYIANSRYCEIKPLGEFIDENDNTKSVTSKIKIIREIKFNELVKLDKTGEWCYQLAHCVKNADIELLSKALIKSNATPQLCYRFAVKIISR